MGRYLKPHYLIVFGGLLIGLGVGVFVVDVQPAILGWLFGAGAGLTGGAYVAAIASNTQLAGGPPPSRRDLELDDVDDLFDEKGRLRPDARVGFRPEDRN